MRLARLPPQFVSLSASMPPLPSVYHSFPLLHQVIAQEGRPQKKLYTITEAGQSALQAWVTRPPPPARERNELLLKTYAIWLADPQAALELFETREQFHAGRLALFEQIQASI